MQEQEFSLSYAPRPSAQRLTPAQRAARLRAKKKRQAQRRRNQIIFLSLCLVVLVLLLIGIVKLVSFTGRALAAIEWQSFAATATAADVVTYEAVTYDLSDYVYNPDDARLVLVNANIPLAEDYTVATIIADDATGVKLATEAATSYRAMATAALTDGIELVLTAGYHDADTQQALFDTWQQYYIDEGYTEAQAYDLAQTIVALPSASEHLTGYGADILSSDYLTEDVGYADTAAFAWLERYAAEYGFILRYPQDSQMITGRVYEPWHWRYVGVDNAKAIVQSGVTLEEFIALGGPVIEDG